MYQALVCCIARLDSASSSQLVLDISIIECVNDYSRQSGVLPRIKVVILEPRSRYHVARRDSDYIKPFFETSY